MVKKNIHASMLDGSYKDLAQQIFIILYELPFSKLHYLYSRKQIGFYIVGIIINQRKSPYLEYHKYFRATSDDNRYVDRLEDIELEYKEDEPINDELQEKLDVINDVLYKNYPITNIENFSYVQSAELFSIEIYKLYLKKKSGGNYSFTKLSQELNINRNLISDSIQDAKDIIRREYKKNNKK